MWLILIAVQHIDDISNIVNWIEKVVFRLTCQRELKPIRVVLKYRMFEIVEKSMIFLFVCLFVIFI